MVKVIFKFITAQKKKKLANLYYLLIHI